VSQVIVTQLVVAVLAWRKAAWRPSLRLSWWRLRRMVAFGVRVSSVDLVAMARMLAESWIITVTLGAPALGLLNVGQRLVLVAQELVAASIVPVSTIVFARVRDSADRLRTTYLKALGVAYAAVSPVMILIVVTAPELIPLIFGAQWSASVQPAQALAVAGIITLGAMLDHGLLYGLGRPGTWFSYAVVVDGVTVATTAITVRWGLTGVAVGFVVVAMLATVARWLLVSRLCGWGIRVVARPFFTVASVTAVTIVLGTVVLDALSGRTWVGLVVAAAATVVGYAVLLRVASRGIIRDALSVLPVPDQYADRAVRLLRLGRAHAA
jgi:O-antigen/teichoic acid export membrane protein